MISEPKQVNSGTPQGVFLKRQMVLKQDGSGLPMLPGDFRIGLDVGILGRSIRIYDCDDYTREFFEVRVSPNNVFRPKVSHRVNPSHSQWITLPRARSLSPYFVTPP